MPEKGRKPVQITGAPRPGRGLGPHYFAYGLFYSVVSGVNINPLRPNPSHSETESGFLIYLLPYLLHGSESFLRS